MISHDFVFIQLWKVSKLRDEISYSSLSLSDLPPSVSTPAATKLTAASPPRLTVESFLVLFRSVMAA